MTYFSFSKKGMGLVDLKSAIVNRWLDILNFDVFLKHPSNIPKLATKHPRVPKWHP